MARQIVITLNDANEMVRVDGINEGKPVEGKPGSPEELRGKTLKHVGVVFHYRKNPECFYYEYLGSIWEVCF
jgi:hypothetical protein